MSIVLQKTLRTLCIIFFAVIVFPLTAQPKKEAVQLSENQQPVFLPETRIHYTAAIDYPLFPAHPELNNFVADIVSKAHLAQTNDMFKTAKEVAGKTESPLNFEVVIGLYDSIYEDSQYISCLLSYYVYAGGAHGSTTLLPVTYSKAEKKLLTLKDVFTSLPENWLETLSAEARRQLADQVKYGKLSSNPEWIESGTVPEEALFSVFKVEKDTVRIIFGQYLVAPYSEGMPEITVPRSFFQK